MILLIMRQKREKSQRIQTDLFKAKGKRQNGKKANSGFAF